MKKPGFSWMWTALSFGLFLAVEVGLGTLMRPAVGGRFASVDLDLKLSMLVMVGSYLAGGFLIALVSPRVRVMEAGTAAFLAVFFTFLYAFFVPIGFIHFSIQRVLIGGAIAFALAAAGADLGERAAARLGNRAAKEWVEGTS